MQTAKKSPRRLKPKTSTAYRRLPLSSLRVFVAVADQLSFTRAAQSLGITAGAVSMQIRSLEEYLQDTIPALAAAAVIAKHNRAEKVEKARVEAEREDLRRREKARKERIQKRREYLTQKAAAFASLEQMRKLRNALVSEVGGECDNQAMRIVQALEAFIEMDELQFQHSAISVEVDDLGLFSDED